MRKRVRRIAKLIDVERAGNLGSQSSRHVLVILRMAFGDVRTRHANLGAERFEMQHLFGGHLVGNHQQYAIALGAGDECEAKTGVAGGRFDNGSARFETAIFFGGGDHGKRDAILDRASGILAFELDEQAAAASFEAGQFDERRIADQAQNGRIIGGAGRQDAHAGGFHPCVAWRDDLELTIERSFDRVFLPV